ncbi:hypothetical protein Vretifemale_17931 [Volvox reticuliferus]|uniref:Telomerase reverse transcriptase n=1 Tax=Volvox reticuliferus TaxID=1737510 RepID=A0A8J4CWK1_9CHLO|nr:hypothetical protein Vretifemale_17931 [Volvox reticuliferus]
MIAAPGVADDGDQSDAAVMVAEPQAKEPLLLPQAMGTARCVAAVPPPLPPPAHTPAVYIVCADITKAYDSLLQSRLMALVESLVDHPDYLMLRGVEVSPSVGLHGVRSRPSNTAHPGALSYPGYPAWLAANKVDAFNTIFLDKQRPIPRGEVISLLRQAVGNNLMRVGSSWFRQAVGIAQGAVTSTLLCSLYMASLEQQHLLPLLPRPAPTCGGNATVAGTATAVVLPPRPQPQQPELPARRRGRRGGRRPARRQPRQRHVHGQLSEIRHQQQQQEGQLQQQQDQNHPQRLSGALKQAEPIKGDSVAAHAQGLDLPLVATRVLGAGAEHQGTFRTLLPSLLGQPGPPPAVHCLPRRNTSDRVAADATALLVAAVANTPTATPTPTATDHRNCRSDSVGLTALAAAFSVAAATTGSLSVGDGSGGSGQFASMLMGHSEGLRSPPGSGIYGAGPGSGSKSRSVSEPGSGSKSAASLRASAGSGVSFTLLEKVAPLTAVTVALAAASVAEEQYAMSLAAPSAVPLPLTHPHQRLLKQLQRLVGVNALASWLQPSSRQTPKLPLPYPAQQPHQYQHTHTQQAMDIQPGLAACVETPGAPLRSDVEPVGWSAGVNGITIGGEGGAVASSEAGRAAAEAPGVPGSAGRIEESHAIIAERQTPVSKHNRGPASAAHNCGTAVLGPPLSVIPGSRVSVAASAPYGKAGRLGLSQRGALVAVDVGLAAATPLRRCPLVLSQSQQCKLADPNPPLALSQNMPQAQGQGPEQEQQQRWLMPRALREERTQAAVVGVLQVQEGDRRKGLTSNCSKLLPQSTSAPVLAVDSGRWARTGPETSYAKTGGGADSGGNRGKICTQPGTDIPSLDPSSGNSDESVPPSLMAALVLETPLPLQLQLPAPYPPANPESQQPLPPQQYQQQALPNEQMEEQMNQLLGHQQGEQQPRQRQQEPQQPHSKEPWVVSDILPEAPLQLQLPPHSGSNTDTDGTLAGLSLRVSLRLQPGPGNRSMVDSGRPQLHVWPQPQLQGAFVPTPRSQGPPRVHAAGSGDRMAHGTPANSPSSPPSVITITSTTNTSAASGGAAVITISSDCISVDAGSPVVAGGVVTSASPVGTPWHLKLAGGRRDATDEVLPDLHLSMHDSGVSVRPDLRGGGTNGACIGGLGFSRILPVQSSGGIPGGRMGGGTGMSTGGDPENYSAVRVEVIDLRDSPPGAVVDTSVNTDDKLAGAEQLDAGADTMLGGPCLRTSSLPFLARPLPLFEQHEQHRQAAALHQQHQQLREDVMPVTQDLCLSGGPGLESGMGRGLLAPGGATQPLPSPSPPPLAWPPARATHSLIVGPGEGGFHVTPRAPAPANANLATGLAAVNSPEVLGLAEHDTQPLPTVQLAGGIGTAAIEENCTVACGFTAPLGNPPTLQLASLRCGQDVRALVAAPVVVATQSGARDGRVLPTPLALPLTQAMEPPEVSGRTLAIRASPAPAALPSPAGDTQPVLLSAHAVDFGCLQARWQVPRWLPNVATIAALCDGQEAVSQHPDTQPMTAMKLQGSTVIPHAHFGSQALHMEQQLESPAQQELQRCQQQQQPALPSPPSPQAVAHPRCQALLRPPTLAPVPPTQLQSELPTQTTPLPVHQLSVATALPPLHTSRQPHEGPQMYPAGTQPISFAPEQPVSVVSLAHIPIPLLPTQPTASAATDMDMPITRRTPQATTEAEAGAPARRGSDRQPAGDTQTVMLRAAGTGLGGRRDSGAGAIWDLGRAAQGGDSSGSGPGCATASGPNQSSSMCCGYSDEDVWLRVGRATAAAVAGTDGGASVHRAASIAGVLHTPTHTFMHVPARDLPLLSSGAVAVLTNKLATAATGDVPRAAIEDSPSSKGAERLFTRDPPAAAVGLVNAATAGMEAAGEPGDAGLMTTDSTVLGLADMDIDTGNISPVDLMQLGLPAGFIGAVSHTPVPLPAGRGAISGLQVQAGSMPEERSDAADGDAMQLEGCGGSNAMDLDLPPDEKRKGVTAVAAGRDHVAGTRIGGSTDPRAAGAALDAEPVPVRQLRGCRGGRRVQWRRMRQQTRQQQQQQQQQQFRCQDLILRSAADKLPLTAGRNKAVATSAAAMAAEAGDALRQQTAAAVANRDTATVTAAARGDATGNIAADATAGPRGYKGSGSIWRSAGGNSDRPRADSGADGARTAAAGAVATAAMLTAGPGDGRLLQARGRAGLGGSALPPRPQRPTDQQPGLLHQNPSQYYRGGREGLHQVPNSEHAVRVLRDKSQSMHQLQQTPRISQLQLVRPHPQPQPPQQQQPPPPPQQQQLQPQPQPQAQQQQQQQNEQRDRDHMPQHPHAAIDRYQIPRRPSRPPQPNPHAPTHPESLLMRLIDDFFIMTTSRAAAEAVARRLREGFLEDYGCVINPGKTQLANFQLPSTDQPPITATADPRVRFGPQEHQDVAQGSGAGVRGGGAEGETGGDPGTACGLGRGAATAAGGGDRGVHVVQLGGDDDGGGGPGYKGDGACNLWQSRDGRRYVRWCGLLFNVATLEVQADYSRYCGVHIRTTMSVPVDAHPGRQLSAKVCQYLRPKAHALLLDTSINSPNTVRLNIYQAYLLAAIKMHWYLHCLPGNLSRDPRVALSAIQSGICYMVALVRSRTDSEATNRRFGPGCRCNVSSCHVRWLGLVAFRRVLFRKQSRYRVVLACLDKQLAAPSFAALPRQLAEVVSEETNAVFNDVLY